MNSQRGFTLIELMVVVVIISILAAFAIPSYQRYVRRTVCQDAQATLLAAASALERYRAQHNHYDPANANKLAELGYSQSPKNGRAEFTLTRSGERIVGSGATAGACTGSATGTSFCLQATPVGSGLLQGTGTLTLDSKGERGGSGALQSAWENNCNGI